MDQSALFNAAKQIYADQGVDVEAALRRLRRIELSIHAWQGDDVTGFEEVRHALTGGCQVTGNYPGRARTAAELRADLDFVLKLIPGKNRVCLQGHEVDRMFPGVDRDAFTIDNFRDWQAWGKEHRMTIDIAPAFYAHPKLDHGLSLSHPDAGIRKFWINHARAIRRIAAEFGRAGGSPSVCNQWAPDGYKDTPSDRLAPRRRLRDSLDEIFADVLPETEVLDAVEPKLFGIGTESFTVGSHDFYLGYASTRQKLICIDSGHFHPTESIADKLSAIHAMQGRMLLHVSRGVRWDSDHVLVLNDELLGIGREIAACGLDGQIAIGLDYFDASINRIAAWTVGARNMLKALLIGFLEPKLATECEAGFDFTGRLAAQEAARTLPWGAVWRRYCEENDMPSDEAVMAAILRYEKDVLSGR
ncbi:L-rhamnose isomerase [bioreactor metagenome]|uniref:L-rhamnose isomerase n=1 Tax=bioreactor metagenome TaxID=1076179 RepID=A0A644ZBU2_9ZZZZ